MPDKTALGVSPELRQYIEALVEEIILEGKTFESQKRYLRRFCGVEGLDYSILEENITGFIETFEELKIHESKSLERYAKALASDSCLDAGIVDKLMGAIKNKRRSTEQETKMRIAQKVKKILVDKLGVDESEIIASTPLKELNIDSLDTVELLMEFEKNFQINFTDEMINGLKTVGDIIDRLYRIDSDLPSTKGQRAAMKKNSMKNDYRVFTYKSGDRYEGDWKDGKKDGQGIMYYADGNKYEGRWKDDQKDGYGVYTWSNGDRFEGNFKNSIIEGPGRYFWLSGHWFEGLWSKGLMNGVGTYYWSDGGKDTGLLVNDKREGKWIRINRDGTRLEATYKNGDIVDGWN